MRKTSKPNNAGYRKPPVKSRFKRGQSGNPKGRPKGSKNLASIVHKELGRKVSVTEDGQQRRISKGEAIVKRLVNQAASGDSKATQTIFAQTRHQPEEGTVLSPALAVFDTAEDQLVMADIVRRIRSMEHTP
jgi:hypothetical protein